MTAILMRTILILLSIALLLSTACSTSINKDKEADTKINKVNESPVSNTKEIPLTDSIKMKDNELAPKNTPKIAPETKNARQNIKESLSIIEGLLNLDELGMFFQSCSPPYHKFRLSKVSPELRQAFIQKSPLLKYPGEPLVASFKALTKETMDEAGFQGVMDVQEIITINARNSRTNCMPYSFSASGNEPYWHLYISDLESLIYFKSLGDNLAVRFPYQSPIVEENKYAYTAKDNRDDFIKIELKEGKCKDNMSGKESNYSITVIYQNQTFQGCAFVGPEVSQ